MKKILGIVLLAAVFTACKENGRKTFSESEVVKKIQTNDGTIIRNNIALDTKGDLKVEQAFMLRANGSLVNDSNEVKVGEMIELRLLVNGWKSQKDSIALGASEKIVTNDGTSVVDVADLFKDQAAIPLNKAQMIRMQATVTKQEKEYSYYKVDFKVWNKDADQSLTGSYQINIVK
ncbi:MAG: hypothetical protein DI598_03335 [Pseudopedobacter saltans]|uniref:Uncharacterized protein n=1 Tax=Pseudopedobacter saltans TaxID=151895 RepID=A0A2W5H7E7_9SPHI|nr:MAG: hypothetical protein DI598_03335 [Pseudopedobacter saltans]